MNFQAKLEEIVGKVPGAQAAILMGFDGIPVADVKAAGAFSMQDTSVEWSRFLREAQKVSLANNMGTTQELVVTTEAQNFIFRYINENYFVGLALSKAGILGKGRFLLQKAAPLIHADL